MQGVDRKDAFFPPHHICLKASQKSLLADFPPPWCELALWRIRYIYKLHLTRKISDYEIFMS